MSPAVQQQYELAVADDTPPLLPPRPPEAGADVPATLLHTRAPRNLRAWVVAALGWLCFIIALATRGEHQPPTNNHSTPRGTSVSSCREAGPAAVAALRQQQTC
jgi:hypothetical protein